MDGRYLPGDKFGEIDQHTILIPFQVTAGSRTMAIRKLLWALGKTLPMPCMSHDGPCDCVTDDPRVIAYTWDWPDEFIELGMDDRVS